MNVDDNESKSSSDNDHGSEKIGFFTVVAIVFTLFALVGLAFHQQEYYPKPLGDPYKYMIK